MSIKLLSSVTLGEALGYFTLSSSYEQTSASFVPFMADYNQTSASYVALSSSYSHLSSSFSNTSSSFTVLSSSVSNLSSSYTQLSSSYTTTSSSFVQFSASFSELVQFHSTLTVNSPGVTFGDCVSPDSIAVGTSCYVRVPYSGTITRWDVVSDSICSASIDIWKSSSSLPTVSNTIVASAKPGLNFETVATNSTLSGWTTTVSTGDIFGFNLSALSGSPNQITLTLRVM